LKRNFALYIELLSFIVAYEPRRCYVWLRLVAGMALRGGAWLLRLHDWNCVKKWV